MPEDIMKNVSITEKWVKCSVNSILNESVLLLGIVYDAIVPNNDGYKGHTKNIYLGALGIKPASYLDMARDDGSAIRFFKDDSVDELFNLTFSNETPNFTSILKIDDYGNRHEFKNQKYFPLRRKEYLLPDLFHFREIESMPPASLDIIDFVSFNWRGISPKRLISITFKDMPKEFFDKIEKNMPTSDKFSITSV